MGKILENLSPFLVFNVDSQLLYLCSEHIPERSTTNNHIWLSVGFPFFLIHYGSGYPELDKTFNISSLSLERK